MSREFTTDVSLYGHDTFQSWSFSYIETAIHLWLPYNYENNYNNNNNHRETKGPNKLCTDHLNLGLLKMQVYK